MANTRGVPNYRSPTCPKPPFLPPRSPFPSTSPTCTEHLGYKSSHIPREVPNRHQRTSSESFLLEEQPSWLEDLLNEPETPMKKGIHRRSSSDSFAYVDTSLAGLKREKAEQERLELSRVRPVQYPSNSMATNNLGRTQNRRDPGLGNTTLPNMIAAQQGPLPGQNDSLKKKGEEECREQDSKTLCEKMEDASSDNSQTEADSKRVKQKFAQRSRVRKLQYIAELERNCQALQVGGCEVSAELEFLDKQNLILNLENTALKQRLDSLAQEHFIKHLQQEMLEREIARLQALHLLQQQQQMNQCHLSDQPIATHRRAPSRDLDTHFANLSLKHRESKPGRDPVNGPLHI